MAGPVVQRRKAPIATEMTKQSEPTERAMENSAIEELARKFEAVSLANMSRRGQKGKDPYRCVCCDSVDHARKDCVSLQDAIRQNLVYMEGNIIIHSSETHKPLQVNFGRGGLKKSMDEADVSHVEAIHYAASAGIRIGKEKLGMIKPGTGFWPTVLEYKNKGKINSDDAKLANLHVRDLTGWADPVDNNTISAEVICETHEVFVDEKRKRADLEEGPSKKHDTRSTKKKEEVITTIRQEDGSSNKKVDEPTQPIEENVKKGKDRSMPTYKLRSDIEQTTNLRKVLEERVLDSRIDLTLRELLGIAKKEFHKTIDNLIKQKREQVDVEEGISTKVTTNAITMARTKEKEEDRVDNHYTRPHSARVTTETPVKIGEKKEIVVALIDHGL